MLKRKGFFRQGRLDGESESYDEKGRLIEKSIYKNGQEVSSNNTNISFKKA
jgi:antitoxin component YwqK of YwqJK toxin-antitoxin module